MGILHRKNIKHKNVYRSMVLTVVGQMTALSKCLWCGTCDCIVTPSTIVSLVGVYGLTNIPSVLLAQARS